MSQPNRPFLRLAFACAALGGIPAAPAFAADPPATRPAADRPERPKPDENILRIQRMQRDNMKNQFSGFQDLGMFRLDALVQLSVEDGMLHVETVPEATAEMRRAKVEGSSAVWAVSRQPAPALAAGPRNFGPTVNLQRIDPDARADEQYWSVYVSCNNRFLNVMAQSVLGRVTFNQTTANGNPACALTVMQWGPGGRMQNVVNVRGPSLMQIRAEHPDEFREYLLPVLAKLSDLKWLRPGAADVYSAFAQIPADPQVTEKVEALLPDLDSAAFATRHAASAKLDELGPAGVLAALRMDPAGLTEEQKGRLGEFVARHRRRDFDDPAAARRDANFLADALEYDDPAVRKAAREALSKVLGKPVEIDASLTGPALTEAVDALRKKVAELAPATQPATQPAVVRP